MSIGYIEAKDVGTSLEAIERSEQLTRYRRSLVNLILTDNLEFRWYVNGDPRTTARLGRVASGRITTDAAGLDSVADLLRDFLSRAPDRITRPEDLASRLARMARLIHDMVLADLTAGTASNNLRDLLVAFRSTLLPDLTPAQFADELAQTLAYGLFAARVYHVGTTPFRRQDAAREIPRTNPFIRQLIGAVSGPGLDDEPFVGFVDDIAALLANADIDAVLANFGTRTRRQDPVVHFYETFLSQYDPELREARGVYFTPEPVVSFIVRSVDETLTSHFGLVDGIADTAAVAWQREGPTGAMTDIPRVQILDPATGTGTFLYVVIDEIRQRFVAAGNAGRWPAYVHDQLLPRISGFELLIAPYVVAHLKLALQLAGLDLPPAERATWEYTFQADERLGVYLTNSLEEATTPSGVLFARYISDEANAASEVKRDRPIMVVLGNPPYSGHSVNNSEWVLRLLDDYYSVDGVPIREANTKWLRDDYVKFIRFGQWRVEKTGAGILAYITNHRYLRNQTFRGMRQQLLHAFDEIYVLNLHGNRRMREQAPNGGIDRNVFDIEQGVAIGIFVRHEGSAAPARVFHAHVYGDRPDKYEFLDSHVRSTVRWDEVVPEAPNFLFEPRDAMLQAEFDAALGVDDAFPLHSLGYLTKRDNLTVALTREALLEQVGRFLDSAKTDEEVAREFNLPMADRDRWVLRRDRAAASPLDPARAERVLYRPFDWRWLYADPSLIARPNTRVLRHMRHPNFALLAGRQGESTGTEWEHGWATDGPSDHNVFARGGATVFPLYVYQEDDGLGLGAVRDPNVSANAIDRLTAALGLSWVGDGAGDLTRTIGPEGFFFYVYAIVCSPAYRSRYEEALGTDFPHVPLTTNIRLFAELCDLGRRLFRIHTLDRTVVSRPTVSFPIVGSNIVEPRHPRHIDRGEDDPNSGAAAAEARMYINRTMARPARTGQYLTDVGVDAWSFSVGGYQPAADWLAARRGIPLDNADLEHVTWMLSAIANSIELVAEIDRIIDAHGGWPIR